MFDKLIDQWRPHAIMLGERAEGYADRITGHLATIAQNTYPDSDEITRSYIRNVVQAGDTGRELFQIPAGETWHLEAVTAVSLAGGAATFTLRNGPGGTPLYANNGSSPGTMGGSGVVFSSSMTVTIDNGANALELTLQVRIEIKEPKRKVHTRAAGTFEQRPPASVDQNTERHVVAGLRPVNNIHGERVA